MEKLLVILVLLFSFMSCRKEPKQKFYPLDETLKAKYHYKDGSYWIYRDSISGRIDSFYLSEVENRYAGDMYPQNSPRYEFIYISIRQKNSVSTLDSIAWTFGFDAMYKPNPLLAARYYRNYGDKAINFLNFFSNNLLTPQSNLNDYWDSTTKGFMNILPTYELQGNTFKNVAEIHYGKDSIKSSNSVYYFNDSVGYIKMRLNYDDGLRKINEVWELKKWNIIK